MEIEELHSWNVNSGRARQIQEEFSQKLVSRPLLLSQIKLVAGVDVSMNRGDTLVHCAVVVLDSNDFALVDSATVSMEVEFPYIPGLLSFREGPPVIKAFKRLNTTPDAVIFDGQGYAHPRRMGLACHLGIWLDLPSVGCAKSRLIGEYQEPGVEKGESSPLILGEEKLGTVLRSRSKVKPVFVSRGHHCDDDSALKLVEKCITRYRLPETTRLAHSLSNQVRLRAGC